MSEFFKSYPSVRPISDEMQDALNLKVDKVGTDDIRITTLGGGLNLVSMNGIYKKVFLEDDGDDAFISTEEVDS